MSTEKQIRSRKSYKFYRKVFELASERQPKELLKYIHTYMESGNKHGSASNANWAMESIDQVLKENHVSTNSIC
jgi:hypothetical protein